MTILQHEGQGVDRGELRRALVEWRNEVFDVGGLATLTLRHQGTRPTVQVYTNKSEENVDDLTKRIAERVESDLRAQLAGIEQLYVLEACWGTNDFPTGFHRMKVFLYEQIDTVGSGGALVPHPGGGGGGSRTEETLRRALKDTLETSAKKEKYHSNGMLRQLAMQQSLIEMQYQQIDKLQNELASLFRAFQGSMNEQQARDMKAAREKELMKGLGEILDTIKVMGPILVNHHLGEKVLPVPDFAHPMVEALKQLYEAVTGDPETLAAILGALGKSKPALVAFNGLMEKTQDWRDAAEAKARLAAEAQEKAKAKPAEEVQGVVESGTAIEPKRRAIDGPFGAMGVRPGGFSIGM
jgi:hypothetical protein